MACGHPDTLYRGYIVWRGRPGREEFVFPSPESAKKWRKVQRLERCPIRTVVSETEFRWQESSGTLKGLELAEHRFQVFEDHKFEPRPFRAYLLPLNK